MVSPGGSAQLVYSDGCKVTLNPGAVLTVEELSPCAANAYAQVGPQAGFDTGWTPYIVGAALVAGGVVVAVVATSKNNNSTPPPIVQAARP